MKYLLRLQRLPLCCLLLVGLASCGSPSAKTEDGEDPFQRFREPVAEDAAADPLKGDPARAAFKPECLALHPIEIRGSAKKPVAMVREQPEVSTTAKLKGQVVVEAIVDASGLVCDARLVSGLGDRIDQASVEAAKKWAFRAGRRRGEAVPCFHTVSFAFDLK